MSRQIGGPDDDSSNRLTARMLLLLNSQPLVNSTQYSAARAEMLDRYWRQETDPEKPYLPVYLINDIRRWWHVLGLNFEFKSAPATTATTSEERRKLRAIRRVNNLKLRYARLLAAYTPILGCLATSSIQGITRSGIKQVLNDTPTVRLENIREGWPGRASELVDEILSAYDEYLVFMDRSEDTLQEAVLVPEWRAIKQRAYDFGDRMWDLMTIVGEGKKLFRYVII
jgi:hypothetical protein